jgi:hypothetical protein
MLEQLAEPVIQLLGTAIVGVLSITLVLINKRIVKWFLDKIWSKISYNYKHGRLKKDEIERDSKIREILIELRTLINADRSGLFQFHNGSTFTTKNPIWKVSNTHESVKPGISSEIGKLQDIKASSITETLQTFWTDNYPTGVEQISPDYCGDCPDRGSKDGKKVIFIDVYNLEDSYSRALLVEQGIKYVLDVPIYNGENNCVGFVAVNYCVDHDAEEIKKNAHVVCRNASQIQFLLLT